MSSVEELLEENRGLRETVRDLLALSTLPAAWVGLGPDEIARSLADALSSALSLELAYIRIAGKGAPDHLVETVRGAQPLDGARLEEVRASLVPLLESDRVGDSTTIPDPFAPGMLHVAITRFGVGDAHGAVVTGCRRDDFPTEREQALLGVGASQTAIVIERRWADERVRHSHARNSATLETALDCIITMDHRGKVVEFNPAAERVFGYRREDVVDRDLADLIIPEALRERHRQGLARYLATGEGPVLGKRLELSALCADGSEIPVELAITRIPIDGPPVFTAHLRDISERVQSERHRNLRLGITQSLAQAATVAEAAASVLRVVCENLGWDIGFFWTLDSGADALVCVDSWCDPGVDCGEFAAATFQHRFRRGEGLPGEAWARGRPAWLLDVTRANNFPRAASAAADGLHGAFACPLAVDGNSLGVIEFFSRRIQAPVPELLETMNTVAGLIGQFLERKQAEEALKQSETRFRGLMEQAPFSIQMFSPDGRTIRVNQAWEELWGVRFEQIETYNILEDRQLEAQGVLGHVQRGFSGQATRIPAIPYNPNDTIAGITEREDPQRWLSAVIYPLKDTNGQIREVVLVHEDITARKRAEEALRESRERLDLALQGANLGYWSLNLGDKRASRNLRHDQIFGYDTQLPEWTYEDFLTHVIPDDRDTVDAEVNRGVASAEPWEFECRIRRADGVVRWLWARGRIFTDDEGRPHRMAGTVADITDRKRLEEELQMRVDQLSAADRQKDEFLATLAHELRNPLAPIRNSLQILQSQRVDFETAQRTREMMERQVHLLIRLVDDLLDVSRVMRGKIELRRKPVELAAVIERAVETAQPLIEACAHELEISVPPESPTLFADPVRLSQVIGNLLTNAAKYTEPGGRISLSAREVGAHAVFRVRDTGIGIDEDLLPHVFDLFVQADHTTTRSQGGLGIGLTLVKSLVEMHGGQVEARSDGPGRGSEFVVRLPLLAEDMAAPEENAGGMPDQEIEPSGLRLLVVDDNQDGAMTLGTLLELQGHEVRVAYDGVSALEEVRDFRPMLVLLDIGMPDMDGYEVARRIRRMPKTDDIVLAALTGWGQEEDRRRTLEAGFDHHLVKPLDPAALENVLSDLKAARAS